MSMRGAQDLAWLRLPRTLEEPGRVRGGGVRQRRGSRGIHWGRVSETVRRRTFVKFSSGDAAAPRFFPPAPRCWPLVTPWSPYVYSASAAEMDHALPAWIMVPPAKRAVTQGLEVLPG